MFRPPSPDQAFRHTVAHHIVTKVAPVFTRPRRLAPRRLKIAKNDFQHMHELGFITPSSSFLSSVLHMAPKKNGDWRPCGDCRSLNKRTLPDRYPIPHIQDFGGIQQGEKVFSKVDLIKAFYQIPLKPADISKTTGITPFGLFEFWRMPFGLRNAAEIFKRLVDTVLLGLSFTFTYIDDYSLEFSNTPEEHAEHLQQLFLRFQEHGLVVNPTKCEFCVNELEFLGQQVDDRRIQPLPENVAVIRSFPQPPTAKKLRKALGLVTFYRRFIPRCARNLRALLRPTAGQQSKGSATPLDANRQSSISIE